MSEEQKNEQEVTDQPQTSGDTPDQTDFLDGTYRGQKVSWSKEEAQKLAQKGLDYETKMAAVNAEKEVVASEKEDFSRWKAWRESLQADPARAEAVARAWQDPQAVLNPQVQEGEMGEAPRQAPPQPAGPGPEVFELRSQIEQLQSKLESFSSEAETKESGDRLERAVDDFNFLSSNPDAKDSALEMARGLMAQDAEMTPEGAAHVAANKLKNILRGQNQQKLDRKGTTEDLRPAETSGGTPQGGLEREKKKTPHGQRRLTTLHGDMMKAMTDGVFKDRFPNAF